MGFLSRLWNLLRSVLGLVLPLFARARDFRGLGRGLRWALHVLLVAALLVGLWWANVHFGLQTALGRAPGALKDFWLPCLFVLVYALSWLGRWLWRLLWPEKEASDFPDIDAAWEEAVAALHQAGIDLAEAPLFLVLGRPAAGEVPLFTAAQLKLLVTNVPRDPGAPLHVYANREGIYVTCPGASLLGRQATLFAEAARGGGKDPSPGGEAAGPDPLGKTIDPYASMRAGGLFRELQAILRRAKEEGRELTEDEKRYIRQVAAGDGTAAEAAPGRAALLNKNAAEVERLTDRLKHLCRLIVAGRRPYCPLNGLLVLVPLAAADGEEVAAQVGGLCLQDIKTTRDVLQLHFPVFALVCDLETLPGFVQFLERFPQDQRQRRVGQRFPLVSDLADEELPAALERLVRWSCQDQVALWVYRLFRVETPEKPEMAEAVGGNVLLYHFLRQMHAKDRPLARLLTRGVAAPHHRLTLFGGCYLAGTGDSPEKQGFIGGVFRRLIESQSHVSWTPEGLAEEASYERRTRRGYYGLGLFALGVAALVGYLCYLTYYAP